MVIFFWELVRLDDDVSSILENAGDGTSAKCGLPDSHSWWNESTHSFNRPGRSAVKVLLGSLTSRRSGALRRHLLLVHHQPASNELDPCKREATWVTLDLTSVPALQDALGRMCLSTTAASEFVDPRTYLWVARALGKEDWTDVAPYKLASSFLGARALLWVCDDNPRGLPATRLLFEGRAGSTGRWLGTAFLVAYQMVPKTLPAPVPVSATAAVRPGTAHLCAALDTQAVWGQALESGALRVEWLSAEEAAAAPQTQFQLDVNFTHDTGGAGVAVSMQEKSLRNQCAACGKMCRKLCQRCKQVAYCDAACQRQHWREHKQTCVRRDGKF